MPPVDHLVYAVPDLEKGISDVERLIGIRAAIGGSHPGMGTRNALISLGDDVYLEIIGPDPDQLEYRSPRVFRIDEVDAPRLITWAAKSDDIGAIAAIKLPGGMSPGAASGGARRTPGGDLLEWELTDPYVEIADGIVPFFIDWKATRHPARMAPGGAKLVGLHAEHPDPDRVSAILEALHTGMRVLPGRVPALVATLETPKGTVELR